MAALCASAVAAGLAGCGAVTSSSQTTVAAPRGPVPVVVPLAVHSYVGGARPIIKIRVGNGRPVPVLLDTGSVGLRLYAPAVKLGPRSGVTMTAGTNSETFADGTVEQGTIGRARLSIGSVKTRPGVRFVLISHIGCWHDLPGCPGADGIRGFTADGEYGILGIGLRRPSDGLVNPLLALPASYRRTWSVELTESGGSLVLRPRMTGRPMAQFQLRPDGKRSRRGPRAWNDLHAKVCWAEVDLRGAACEPTAFDSGSTTMQWYGGLLGRSDTSITRVFVNPGEYIAAWQPGRPTPFWTFTSGRENSHDSVIALRRGHPLVVADVHAFLQFKIVFDDVRGRIALYPQGAP